MSLDVHTVAVEPAGSAPSDLDRLKLALLRDIGFPVAAAALTALGAITAGTGFTALPILAPTGGTLTAGVSPADPAVAIATSLKCVTASPATPGSGVDINDTFTLGGGKLQTEGPYGDGTTTVPAPTLLTVTHAQLVAATLTGGGVGTSAGYAAGNTITTAGGTAGTHAVITVDTVDGGGGILTWHISTPGDYTVEAASLTQGSTSGAGTGATFGTALYGALTFAITRAGGYVTAPPTTNTPTNGTGTGTGVTVTAAFGLGTALLLHSGNYSGAPSFTVTPADGNGSGASIATATLGGNGATIPRLIKGPFPSQFAMIGTLNGQQGSVNTIYKSDLYASLGLVPPTASTTLAAGTFDALMLG